MTQLNRKSLVRSFAIVETGFMFSQGLVSPSAEAAGEQCVKVFESQLDLALQTLQTGVRLERVSLSREGAEEMLLHTRRGNSIVVRRRGRLDSRGNEAWMAASWLGYRMVKGSSASLVDVIALTRVIESIGMTQTVQSLTKTKVDMIVGAFDEVIPSTAPRQLFATVPSVLRGKFQTLFSTYEIVDTSAPQIAQLIQSSGAVNGAANGGVN